MKRFIIPIICYSILIACGTQEEKITEGLAATPITTFISSEEVRSQPAEEIRNQEDHSNEFLRFETMKEIKDGIFQSVEVVELTDEMVSINFYTWELVNKTPVLLDILEFNNDTLEYGEELGWFYLTQWNEIDAFYLSYHDIIVEETFIEAAMNGTLISSLISLGNNEDELLASLGEPILTDWYSGGLFYYYNDIAYILDEAKVIVAINMPGQRINHSLATIIEILGEPTSRTYSEIDNMIVYCYQLGANTLSFEGYTEEKEVVNIWLTKKS